MRVFYDFLNLSLFTSFAFGRPNSIISGPSVTFADSHQASAIDLRDPTIANIYGRATAQAPKGYAPAEVRCPSRRPAIRAGGDLSPEEQQWLNLRRRNTVDPMRQLLARLNITGFDASAYISRHSNNISALPNIGIAASGGGYRALQNGAGALAAFDSRTPNSTNTGQLGGLLQSATYLAGLSGGGWLVGSIMTNNFSSVQDLMTSTPDRSGGLWQFGRSILQGMYSVSKLAA